MPSPSRAIVLVASLLVTSLAACADPVSPVRSDLITTRSGDGSILLVNQTATPVYYLVAEREYAASALFALCPDPPSEPADACTNIPPHSTVSVRHSAIAGYRRGAKEAIVMHWVLTPRAMRDGLGSELRSLVVELR